MAEQRHSGTGICHGLGTRHQLGYNRSYQQVQKIQYDRPTEVRNTATPGRYVSRAWRAFLLATSAGPRARLMLPKGALSGVECPVTSK